MLLIVFNTAWQFYENIIILLVLGNVVMGRVAFSPLEEQTQLKNNIRIKNNGSSLAKD